MVSSIAGSMAASWASSLFSKLDTNNQGYIDREGLQSAFSQIDATDASSTDTNVDAIFTQIDTDGDGKITETELSDTLSNLVDQLYGKDGSLYGGNSGPGMPPPPPPGGMDAADEGFTQDELTGIAAEIGDGDSRRSSLMANLAANFETADTDGNGRINREEAMAYDQSSRTDTADATTDGSDGVNSKATALLKLIELIQSYASTDDGTKNCGASDSISLTA